jgi:hypothetical protein
MRSIGIRLFVTAIIKGYSSGCSGEDPVLILLSYSTLGLFASKASRSTKMNPNLNNLCREHNKKEFVLTANKVKACYYNCAVDF